MTKGPAGSFSVAVEGVPVAERRFFGFPSEDEIVDAVASKLGR